MYPRTRAALHCSFSLRVRLFQDADGGLHLLRQLLGIIAL